ncbi:reverse transcriptase family protein [Erwinia persicina]|uniref:reverse transcriptase family protein n=1 Tax=Erwinia persicina TaxID=55211 RepID=UPI001781C184|nr:reverse transcriptase family protein [Erwinia persicina]MBD8216730.1 RNA-directed DNA polymerase [Erwinia persicina]
MKNATRSSSSFSSLKNYPINQSPLFKLTTKKKLLALLGFSLPQIEKLSKDSSYRVFLTPSDRCVQEPILQLKKIHKKIGSLLNRIEQPDYIHSGRKKRSIITNAKVHQNSYQLLKLDIHKFFPSTSGSKIYRLFVNDFQMQPDVAHLLTNLVTYNYSVPTGSPLSMVLAYWANKSMFDELYQLANENDLDFSVYVDDVAFSGEKIPKGFSHCAKSCISKHGMKSKSKKEMFYQENQAKLLTGVIISDGVLKTRWKHSQMIKKGFETLALQTSDGDRVIALEKLTGRLHAAGQIDPRIKSKAIHFSKILRAAKLDIIAAKNENDKPDVS